MRRRLLGLAVAVVVFALLVPVVAFGVIPIFVHSRVVEPLPMAMISPTAEPVGPSAAPGSAPSATPDEPRTLAVATLRHLDPVHYGSGRVLLLQVGARRLLRFDQVDIAGAPNMFVYLSERTDGQPGRYLDLGPLRATTGSFNYDIPADADLSATRSVVVWCRAFTLTVTYGVFS